MGPEPLTVYRAGEEKGKMGDGGRAQNLLQGMPKLLSAGIKWNISERTE